MKKIDKILSDSLTKKGIGQAAKSALVCFWADKWGNGRFSVISFQNGILKVSVESSPAASELEIAKEDLIDEVNKKANKRIVRQVRILVGRQRRDSVLN
ncbi:MAG: DciA family protein [Patescibacteria group bacterium]